MPTSPALVAEYRYNGLGFRIGVHYDVTRSASPFTPDGVVDGSDPWFYTTFDERWRNVATSRSTDANPKEFFVYHAAGAGGMGGSPEAVEPGPCGPGGKEG